MGRLIDADALTGYVTELYEYDICHDDADEYSEGRASAEHGILEKIRELPTIDAVPVEWMKGIRDIMRRSSSHAAGDMLNRVIEMWEKEQEAR